MYVDTPEIAVDVGRPRRRWAESGGMDLTGEADGPPLCPPAPVAAVIAAAGAVVGAPDAAALVGERGLSRHGATSCGGATRLLECADGWLAVALPRPEDVAALPAWVGVDAGSADEAWPALSVRLKHISGAEAVEHARLLELAVTQVGETPPAPTPWILTRHAPASAITGPPRVVDLSALWAGPLCGDLLQRRGGHVRKAEDRRRPDGSRATPDFYSLLNGAKEATSVDVHSQELHHLLRDTDVVITSARPRALEQLGVDVDAVLAARPTVWVAITAHGWDGPGRNRVGFGDDVAVSAGLTVDLATDRPGFVADAVGDPLCGTLAAAAATMCLERGGSWFIDISLARAAAFAMSLADGGTVAAVRDHNHGDRDGTGWTLLDGDDLVAVAPARRR